jgi:hypothetical protein
LNVEAVEASDEDRAFIAAANPQTILDLLAELARVRGLLQRQWVSVEERLPTDMRIVNIALCSSVVATGWYNHGKAQWRMWGYDNRKNLEGVTHWQPLPATVGINLTDAPKDEPTIIRTEHPEQYAQAMVAGCQHVVPTFPQSSSPVSQGAESADIGKLDTADESGEFPTKENLAALRTRRYQAESRERTKAQLRINMGRESLRS